MNLFRRPTRSAQADEVLTVIDRYLREETQQRGLMVDPDVKNVHPRDLPPDKREAMMEEVFKILAKPIQ